MKNILLCLGLMAFLSPTLRLDAQSQRELLKVRSFTDLSVGSGINVILTASDEHLIRIEGERTAVSKVFCDVQEGTLIIAVGKYTWKKNRKIDVYVTYDGPINSITCSSGSDIRSETPIRSSDMQIVAKSGCDLYLSLDVEHLKLKIGSGSDARLVGKAGSADFFVDNGSQLNAFGLDCAKVWASVTLASKAFVYSSGYLGIAAGNDSEVRFKGNPATREITQSGGSRVLEQ